MKKMWKRLVVVISAVFITIIILEIFLRVTATIWIYSTRRNPDLESMSINGSKNRNEKVVVCYGDSFTFGVGGLPDRTYPDHLQKMLKEIQGNNEVVVINRGMSAYNSARILAVVKEERDLERYSPDVVIIMLGDQNYWDLWGFNLGEKRYILKGKIQNLLYRIRVFRLVKLLIKNIREVMFRYNSNKKQKFAALEESTGNVNKEKKIEKNIKEICDRGDKFLAQGAINKGINCFKEALKLATGKRSLSYVYYSLGYTYTSLKKYNKAIEYFIKGIKTDPAFSINYRGLGYAYEYSGEYSSALIHFKTALEKNPFDYESCRGFVDMCIRLDRRDYGIAILKKFMKYNPALKNFIGVLESKNDFEKVIDIWLERDLCELVKICQQKGCKVIIMNYPYPATANHVLEKVAKKMHLVFVDNYAIFKDKWLLYSSGLVSGAEFYSLDGHCNSKGYELIAQNIVKKIQEFNILDLK